LVGRSRETPALYRYYWDTIEACVPPAQVMAGIAAAGFASVRRGLALGIFSEYGATA
jgi:demethylmenaquinone methyltransferase/2-methoxy-6-polyprenyl-1,4-benzoquinol methylase